MVKERKDFCFLDSLKCTKVCVWLASGDFSFLSVCVCCLPVCVCVCFVVSSFGILEILQSGRGGKMALGEGGLATADERAQALDVSAAATA